MYSGLFLAHLGPVPSVFVWARACPVLSGPYKTKETILCDLWPR